MNRFMTIRDAYLYFVSLFRGEHPTWTQDELLDYFVDNNVPLAVCTVAHVKAAYEAARED